MSSRRYYKNRKKHYRYYQRKNPLYKKKWFWKLTFGLFIFCGTISLFFYLPIFQIQEIKIEGYKSNKDFLTFYKSVFNNQNIFFYFFSNLNNQVLKSFPDIKNISASFVFPNEINIKIQERKPISLVCNQNNDASCFIMDNSGILYKKSNSQEGSKELLLIKTKLDLNSLKLPIKFLDESTLKDVNLILDILEKNKLGLSYFELNFDDIVAHLRDGSIIYFSKKNIENEVLNLSFVLEKEVIKPGNFKVIDLRSEEDRIIFY